MPFAVLNSAVLNQDNHASSPSDCDLAQRVKLMIEQRQLLKGARVTISARLGIVTLAGSVPSFHQRQLLHSLARHVAGVLQVCDELEVAHAVRPFPSAGSVTSSALALSER
jgi:osmotically-inducible protein OsmY